MDDLNFLTYGDYIILQTTQQPIAFLSGRSLLEEEVYFIQILNEQLGIIFYDNFYECIFRILPKLRYEAVKNLRKSTKEKLLSDEKLEIIKKRVENEKKINEIIIQKYKGKPIYLGDEVHIQHVCSKSFVKCQKTISVNSQQIQPLKLSKDLDSSFVFRTKIDPQLSFKREGEKIYYEDSFYFQNTKNDGVLYYFQEQKLYKNIPIRNPLGINYPTTMEFNNAFNTFKAGHIKNQILTFKAIKINKKYDDDQLDQTKDDNNICWGDFVRINHILRESKSQKVVLECCLNMTGFSPNAFLYQKGVHEDINETISSVFQILPTNINLIGQTIESELKGQYVFPEIIFRHWISGKFLSLSEPDDNQQLYFSLQPSINEFIEKNKITFNDKIIPKTKKEKTFVRRKSVKQTLSLAKLQKRDGELGVIEQYIQSIKVRINTTFQDSKFLTNKCCFSIKYYKDQENQNNCFYLKIKSGYNEQLKPNQIKRLKQFEMLQPKYFSDSYLSQNIEKKIYFKLERSQSQSADIFDFFFLENINMGFITDAISVISEMKHCIILINNHQIIQANYQINDEIETISYCQTIQNASQSLIKICFWLCDYQVITFNLEDLKQISNYNKQTLVMELGLIEIVLNIIFQMQNYKLFQNAFSKKDSPQFTLIAVIIEFLILICRNNKNNSYFVSQWYFLFKNIILCGFEIPNEIKIDKLLQDLFENSQLSKNNINDVREIQSVLQFEQQNIQGLKLLLGFCTNIQELDQQLQRKIISDIIQVNNVNLFRKFQYNQENQKLEIMISQYQIIEFDENLQTFNRRTFEQQILYLQLFLVIQ